ncbi:2'-5' RNA ligase family protein [Nocardioides sp. YIM 152588]|uniref:2'-5' RNA ligase family protein n=1 Tax=Nocardioides sp. YIM 152588 TaxID=3158259 RepID=UPI0032E4010F
MLTIGVAIAIPEPWAARLEEYRRAIGDPTASGVPTHITLIPPTDLPIRDLDVIETHLKGAAAEVEPFLVHLRGTGTFRPVSPVVFVGLVEGISRCEQLAAAVRRGPLAVDLDFPYHPHVTVAHHLGDDDLDRAFEDLSGFDCAFEVKDFHLYVHEGEAGWKVRSTFAL